MSEGPNESELLIEFARAAAKAQEIEAILKDTVIGADVAQDTGNRSFEAIAKEIDKLPLGPLQIKYFEKVGKDIHDPGFKKMFKEINEQRKFLMHRFFLEFPIAKLNGNEEAKTRLQQIDKILGDGREILRRAFDGALALSLKIQPEKFREFLAFVVDHRKKAKVSE